MESLGITKQRRAFHYYTFYTIYMRQLNPDNLTEFSNSALVVDLFVFEKKKQLTHSQIKFQPTETQFP